MKYNGNLYIRERTMTKDEQKYIRRNSLTMMKIYDSFCHFVIELKGLYILIPQFYLSTPNRMWILNV